MRTFRLQVRTPVGLVVDDEVVSVVAEDRSGWFGLRPGRADLVAVLEPGLLVYRRGPRPEDERFVALDGGLLNLERGRCRVTAREAVVAQTLDALSDDLSAQLERRRQRQETHRDVLDRLAREAVRRLAAQGGAR